MKDTPIKSRISFKQLNRISVKNDRIESVSGLDAAFHFEKNEKTGEQLVPINLSIKPVKKVEGFSIKFLNAYNVGGFVGYKFEVSTDSNVMTTLNESAFWSEDDIDLLFTELRICKGISSILYVLARS